MIQIIAINELVETAPSTGPIPLGSPCRSSIPAGDAVLKGFGVRKRERLDFAAMTLDDLPVFSYF
jgi:hypothetical protein